MAKDGDEWLYAKTRLNAKRRRRSIVDELAPAAWHPRLQRAAGALSASAGFEPWLTRQRYFGSSVERLNADGGFV